MEKDYCRIRKDILESEFNHVPITDSQGRNNHFTSPHPVPYRWLNEDEPNEQFQVKILGAKWVNAESIDFEF